jgi:hypothetical protein
MRTLTVALVALAALALAGAAGAVAERFFRLKVGDIVQVEGTNVGCTVIKLGNERLMTCSLVDSEGGVPATYGVSIDRRRVVVCRFDEARDCDPVFVRRHRR